MTGRARQGFKALARSGNARWIADASAGYFRAESGTRPGRKRTGKMPFVPQGEPALRNSSGAICKASVCVGVAIRPELLLLRGGFFAEAAHALLQLFAQRSRSVGIECDEIPERLRAMAAQSRQRRCVAIRMPRDIFADRRVRMMREAAESLRRHFRMLADEPQQIEIFARGLLGKLVEQFGLHFGAQHRADFFIPAGIDAIQLLRWRMNQSFNHPALLIETRRGQCAAFHRIEYAKQMLAFAKHNLRCSHGFAFPRVANQVRTSHILHHPKCFVGRSTQLLALLASNIARTSGAWPSTAFWHCD